MQGFFITAKEMKPIGELPKYFTAGASGDCRCGRQCRQLAGVFAFSRVFLQESHSLLYDKMLLDGTLYSDLKQTEQRYWEQVEQTITKLLVSNPAPDRKNDPLGWTAHMNSLQAQAAELAMPIVTSL